MTHLTSDELIDAMDNALAADRRMHLDACPECRRQLADLAGIIQEAKQAGVQEPSPLFWSHLSANINSEIDRQIAGVWPSWLRWQVLLPLGAAAMIILAIMISVPKNDDVGRSSGEVIETAAAPEDSPIEADNWATVTNLVGELDVDAATEAGVIAPGVADRVVFELTAEEQAELTRLLREELSKAKS